MKNFRSYAFILLALLISDFVFGTLFIPGSLANFYNILTYHPYYHLGFEKDRTGIIKCGNFEPLYFTNSLGLKDRSDRKVPHATDKRRILFIGDSFTEGPQYPYDSTYCGLLTAAMDTSKMEILNGGFRGTSPKLFYLKLDYLLNHEELKVNDVYCLMGFTNIADELVYQNFKPQLPSGDKDMGLSIKKFLMTHSALYFLCAKALTKYYVIRHHLHDDQNYLYWVKIDDDFNRETNDSFGEFKGRWITEEMINKPATVKALALCNENILKMRDLCVSHGVKFHLMLYPISFLVYNPYISYAYLTELDNMYLAIYNNFAKVNNIDLINLFPLYQGQTDEQGKLNMAQYYIPNDNHWNSAGQKRAADSLYVVINR